MSKKVVISADEQGNIIGVSQNNPEYGYIRVEQTVNQISYDGWLRLSKRSAIIKGLVDDLLKAEFYQGQELPGKIVVKESLTPFNAAEPDKNLKIAGDTGVICRLEDQPIYRQSFYTENPNEYDDLIMHTNRQEIKDVQEASRNVLILQQNDQQQLVTL
jgi:hypothetical protein